MPRRYLECVTKSIQWRLLTADRRHKLRTVTLHQVRVATVVILQKLDAVSSRLNGEIGHVDRDRNRKIDLFFDFRIVALRDPAIEQEAGDALIIFKTHAAVAEPQLIFR